ncbi:MAG: hypothetical protein P4M11_08375 [Candidatus Pacebacteria bacterium]|nr:hypothetical protein [Candidatus Paceibacterota bacterium]
MGSRWENTVDRTTEGRKDQGTETETPRPDGISGRIGTKAQRVDIYLDRLSISPWDIE